MSDLLNPIAELNKPDSGKIIIPKSAYLIKEEHKFYCPDHDCRDSERILIPSKSKLDKYFFKHRQNCEHDIRPQTLLHKLAVKWFEDRSSFEIPEAILKSRKIIRQTVELETLETALEYRMLEQLIPDVKLVTKLGFQFAIEIFVTSDVKDEKRKRIDKFDLPTLRIDLSKFYLANKERCRIDYDFVKENLDNLLTNIVLKSWVVPITDADIETKLKVQSTFEPKVPAKSEESGDSVIGYVILAALFIWALIRCKRPKRNPRKRHKFPK